MEHAEAMRKNGVVRQGNLELRALTINNWKGSTFSEGCPSGRSWAADKKNPCRIDQGNRE